MTPLQAAYKHVAKLPPLAPDDPGPFSFASQARVTRILDEAGFTDIAMERCDLQLDTSVGRGLEAAVESRTRNRSDGAGAIGSAARTGRRSHPIDPRGADAFCPRPGGIAAGLDLDRTRSNA